MIKKLISEKTVFLATFFLLALLLARNPFSTRTLIPNLEPYPDTIHYISPVYNFINGDGFNIAREGRVIKPSVPPLYSILMVPFFVLNNDPRMFYFLNVLLSLASFYLIYMITKRITDNIFIISFICFIYVTNFYFYWYPQWAMAENLLLPVYLLGIYLLNLKVDFRKIVLFSVLVVATVLTKYAFWPIGLSFFVLYTAKILLQKEKSRKGAGRKLIIFFICMAIFSIPMLVYAKNTINLSLLDFAKRAFNIGDIQIRYAEMGQFGTSWFSVANVKMNISLYWHGLTGGREKFLWDTTPVLPKHLSYVGLVGLIVALFAKRYRFSALSLVILLLSQIFFISTFWAADMRYLYVAIPTLIIGVTIFLTLVFDTFKHRKVGVFFNIVLSFFLLFYLVDNLPRIRSQVALNLKYKEEPWYYISVLKLNSYFGGSYSEQKPVVISPMVPYYIDFFSNGSYQLLPLNSDQEFRSYKYEAWGNYNYSDLMGVYEALIKQGRDVYVSTYGIGNENYLHNSFDEITKGFILDEVQNDCYGACKIYKLSLTK